MTARRTTDPSAVPHPRPGADAAPSPRAARRLRAPAPGWRVDADVVVVGSGVAGLTAALRCAAAGVRTVVVTKARLDDGSTRWAQGGIAAALGDGDSPEQHLDDTLVAGAGLCDADAVRTLVTEGPAAVRRLVEAGARFDADPGTGEIELTREGGHRRRRIAHAGGDATGAEISRALLHAVRDAGIRTVENALVLDLLRTSGGAAAGVTLHVMGEGRHDGVGAVHAPAVVLATGGMGQIFSATTNPPVSTGDGVALALRAGAEVSDLEFVQFHPTALYLGAGAEGQQPLISEAVRGEGAHLVDADGVRFMTGQHELGELAPRDIVAKAIMRRAAEQGAEPGTEHMFLDARHFGAAMWESRFPTILAACRAHGIDPVTEPVPVAPAAHYASGGVRTDLHGRTTVPGLYACGEVACTGVHGANRLASNSLLEGLVFAERIADAVTGAATASVRAPQTEPQAEPPEGEFTGPGDREPGRTERESTERQPRVPQPTEPQHKDREFTEPEPTEPELTEPELTEPEFAEPEFLEPEELPLLPAEARAGIQRIMTSGAGVLRSAASLTEAAARLDALAADAAAPRNAARPEDPVSGDAADTVPPSAPGPSAPGPSSPEPSVSGLAGPAGPAGRAGSPEPSGPPEPSDLKPAEPGVDTWETANLHLVARVLVAAALRREETRGCHWREDHPDRDDDAWQRHLVVALRDGGRSLDSRGGLGRGRRTGDGDLDVRTTQTTAFPPTAPPPAAAPPHTATEMP